MEYNRNGSSHCQQLINNIRPYFPAQESTPGYVIIFSRRKMHLHEEVACEMVLKIRKMRAEEAHGRYIGSLLCPAGLKKKNSQ
ncbi:hypothetical protein SK128_012424 [Halocaridina rubra]|uniref:Uncharacterized protein n=1 Tax=Halocaridina rubra TaxID=373956 RepID=A0AAN9A540_HALRR